MAETPAPATTTTEQDKHSAGQRWVNKTWEMTQAAIAASTVGTVLYVGARITLAALSPEASERIEANANTAFLFLSNMASLIVGFYFGRTNHQRVGGVDLGR